MKFKGVSLNCIFFLFILILFITFNSSLLSVVYAQSNQTIDLEANIIGDLASEAEISILVSPNKINFGDVELGSESDTLRVNVTNKGSVDINVIPELEDNSEIFKNIYLQKRKTGNSSTLYNIGDFSMNILKPTSESGRSDYFYIKLDLTEIDLDNLDEGDLGNQDAKVIVIALAA